MVPPQLQGLFISFRAGLMIMLTIFGVGLFMAFTGSPGLGSVTILLGLIGAISCVWGVLLLGSPTYLDYRRLKTEARRLIGQERLVKIAPVPNRHEMGIERGRFGILKVWDLTIPRGRPGQIDRHTGVLYQLTPLAPHPYKYHVVVKRDPATGQLTYTPAGSTIELSREIMHDLKTGTADVTPQELAGLLRTLTKAKALAPDR